MTSFAAARPTAVPAPPSAVHPPSVYTASAWSASTRCSEATGAPDPAWGGRFTPSWSTPTSRTVGGWARPQGVPERGAEESNRPPPLERNPVRTVVVGAAVAALGLGVAVPAMGAPGRVVKEAAASGQFAVTSIDADVSHPRVLYGRALGSFFAFLEDGGRERVQDIGPLDVRDYLEAAKTNGLSGKTPND